MRKALLILALCLAPSVASASVAFVGKGTITNTSGSTANLTFNVTTATNECAFAMIGFDGNTGSSSTLAITGVTWNGATMTSAGSGAIMNDGGGAYQNAAIFWIGNPSTGSHTLAVTGNSGVSETYVNMVWFSGANTSACARSGTWTTGTGSSGYSITIPSNTSDLTVAVIDSSGGISGSGTNQTSDGISNAGGYSAGSDHATTAASSITDTWTTGGGASGDYSMAGLSVQAAGGSVVRHRGAVVGAQ